MTRRDSKQGNRQVRPRARPNGIPRAEDFEIVETAMLDLSDGDVLVRNR